MSLLQSIVEEVDRELARLQSLRSIVAGLSRSPEVVAGLISSPVVLPKREAPAASSALAIRQPKPPRKTRADAGKPRERRSAKPRSVSEPHAFAATIPSGPVVFNPVRLAEEKTKREQAQDAPVNTEPDRSSEDLDELSRSLAARWSTGMAQ